MDQINWSNVLIALLSGSGIFAIWLQQRTQSANKRLDNELQARTAEAQALNARLNSEAQREKQAGELDISYVDRLQKRVAELEDDKDRLLHEREDIRQAQWRAESQAVDMARLAQEYATKAGIEPEQRVYDILTGNQAPAAGTLVVPGSPPRVVQVTPVAPDEAVMVAPEVPVAPPPERPPNRPSH